jgi:hypothetical protein
MPLPKSKALRYAAYLFTFYLLLFTFNSCIPPGKLPQRCADQFPCRDSLILRDRWVHDTITFPDYQFEYIDTTHCPPNLVDTLLIIKERIRTVPGPVVAITVPCQDSIIYRRDTALETLLKEQLSAGDATIRSLQRKADRLSAWRWVACALLVGWILLFWVSRRKKA